MSAIFNRKNKQNWIKIPTQGPSGVSIYQDRGVLGLFLDHWHNESPVYLDLDAEIAKHQKFYQSRPYKNEPLYKAVKGAPRVVDMTGGMLGDTLLFLVWGLDVHTYEGNPIVVKLIQDALERAGSELLGNLTFHPEYFSWSKFSDEACYYYDPFFHKEKEKTKVNKEMELLRFLDQEVDFLEKPEQRKVVVKRNLKAQELWEGVHHSFKGKSTRYDVYSQ